MAKGFEINDDFITYCNDKKCDAQKLLDEIINKEMLKEFKIIKVEIIPRRPSHDLEDK